MKKRIQKVLGAALAVSMTISLLSGCGGTAEDPIRDLMGAESQITYTTPMLQVTTPGSGKAVEVQAGDIFYWLARNSEDVLAQYSLMAGGDSDEPDWSFQMADGVTMDQYIKESAKDRAVLYTVVTNKAKEYGYEFTSEDKAAYEEDLAQAQEDLGGEEAYHNWLKGYCLTDAGMEHLSQVGILYEHMLDGLYREGGEFAPSSETLSAYAEENDYLCAKHILFLTQDMTTGQELSSDEIAEKEATAEDVLHQLQEISDPAELERKFDELMETYSEDTGLATHPDGYTFTAGQMVSEFEEATRSLDFGQVSDLVKSSYGYHIILRLDPSASESLRQTWGQNDLDQRIDQWIQETEVEEEDAFANLDVASFYEKLTAYRDTLSLTVPGEGETEEAGESSQEDVEAAESQADDGTDAAESAEAETDQETSTP